MYSTLVPIKHHNNKARHSSRLVLTTPPLDWLGPKSRRNTCRLISTLSKPHAHPRLEQLFNFASFTHVLLIDRLGASAPRPLFVLEFEDARPPSAYDPPDPDLQLHYYCCCSTTRFVTCLLINNSPKRTPRYATSKHVLD